MEDKVLEDLGEGKLPSKEELLEAIQKMSDLDQESKEKLIDSIMSSVPGAKAGEAGFEEPVVGSSFPIEWLMLLSLIALILMVLAYFGYKLYKSLADRERRKEEKKRQKQQKKKK